MWLLGILRTVLMRSSRTFVWSATVFGLSVLLCFFAAIGYDFYRGTMQINEQAASNVAALTEQDIARNIELFDLSLQAVLEGVNDPEIMRQDPRVRQKALFDTSTTAQGLGALVVLDQNGSIILDSLSVVPRKGNFGDREYFMIHRNSPHDIGLYVSRPFKARLQGSIWSISVSRRLSRPDGSFAGIVSGTMKLDYFQRLFGKVTLGANGSITLLRDDGTMIVRNLSDDDEIGHDWSSAPVFSHLQGRTDGTFSSDRSMDGIARLYAFHRVGDLPLVVVVGLSRAHVFAPWWSKILVLSGIFATMAGSVLFLVWMLETELRRRASAESAAAELARTDVLTQLANRRWFEEVMTREWARAERDGHPISLVMIDADHFKRFNDTYGHQEGDRALAAIAGVIAKTTRRAGDLGARYGGEEFAVLLADTDGRRANQVAAAIRDGIKRLRIDHDASEHKVLTVSAGVATAVPSRGIKPAALVRDADAALYRAKGEGRNTVCVSNVVSAGFQPPVTRAS
jgi:diguanylate cyclase (GGDEF)-like protein